MGWTCNILEVRWVSRKNSWNDVALLSLICHKESLTNFGIFTEIEKRFLLFNCPWSNLLNWSPCLVSFIYTFPIIRCGTWRNQFIYWLRNLAMLKTILLSQQDRASNLSNSFLGPFNLCNWLVTKYLNSLYSHWIFGPWCNRSKIRMTNSRPDFFLEHRCLFIFDAEYS